MVRQRDYAETVRFGAWRNLPVAKRTGATREHFSAFGQGPACPVDLPKTATHVSQSRDSSDSVGEQGALGFVAEAGDG
jgi:hypothetical protein